MSTCKDGCPVHKADADRVKVVYSQIVMANWTKKDIRVIVELTHRLMLEAGCRPCPVLDDLGPEALDRAAEVGRLYAEHAKAYITMLYKDK